jgi:hypothetical protein
MLERLNALKEKHAGQRNEATRLIAIVNTQLELEKLWLSAVENEQDFRRKALANTAHETAELYLAKAESL